MLHLVYADVLPFGCLKFAQESMWDAILPGLENKFGNRYVWGLMMVMLLCVGRYRPIKGMILLQQAVIGECQKILMGLN